MQAQLLIQHADGGFGFAHDLVQQALAADLAAPRRKLIHRRLALAAQASDTAPALVALHFEASGDLASAIGPRLAAGDQAQALRALPQAMQHWLQALDNGAQGALALELRMRLAHAAQQRGEYDTLALHVQALRERGSEAALSLHQQQDASIAAARALANSNGAAQALELLQPLLADHAPNLRHSARVQAMTVQLQALRALGQIDDARQVGLRALALPRSGPLFTGFLSHSDGYGTANLAKTVLAGAKFRVDAPSPTVS